MLLTCWLLAGCDPPADPAASLVAPQAANSASQLPQHLYIWQRVWRPAHAQALAASQPDFAALRLLSLQYHASDRGPVWTAAQPDWALLAKDGRPVTLVLRLDGQLEQLPTPAALWQRWVATTETARQHGVALQGVEIDYDAPRSKLGAYQQWLSQLRALLPAALALGMTALPDWLQAPKQFADLCQQSDSLTLQLHSVLSPEQGLFDLPLAQQWTQQALQTPACRLYLALPAYHADLIQTPGGPRIETETPLPATGQRLQLRSEPQQLQAFLHWLGELLTAQQIPAQPMTEQPLKKPQAAQLLGLIWFRLPLPEDRLSWPYATLAAVRWQQPLNSELAFSLRSGTGRYDVLVSNQGNLPASPAQIRQQAIKQHFRGLHCLGGDSLAGLQWQQLAMPAGTAVIQPGLLHWQLQPAVPANAAPSATPALAPGEQRLLGWLQCKQLQQLDNDNSQTNQEGL